MKDKKIKSGIACIVMQVLLSSAPAVAQVHGDSVLTSGKITVVAGKQYNRSSFHNWLWGSHYRKEWATPVQMPLFYLDTAQGGLYPYAAGGGRQSKTLRLRNAKGREYVLRSIDKSFNNTLPPIYQNTFIENIINDQVSSAHPYAAVTIPPMARASKIYHARPQAVYVPQQDRLDSFNEKFGNDLYFFEQRPDNNWEEEENFGNSSNIISTENLLQLLLEDNNTRVDQLAFIRARLFDMFVGDWGRHEDQWRWALDTTTRIKSLYKPIPRDRDQTYTKFEGFLLKFGLAAADLGHLKSFDGKIKDITSYNFSARNLDRRLANETTLTQWTETAKDLQVLLTDGVIESSVNQLPKEVFPISGPEIIQKLKSRRDDLVTHAGNYYRFISKEVDVIGSYGRDYFEVKRLNDEETGVNLYNVNDDGSKAALPLYSRIFKNNETEEVRLYGLKGNDQYHIEGAVLQGIKVRIVGGSDKDEVRDASTVQGKNRTHIYDNNDNSITTSSSTKLHLSEDSSIHSYQYDAFAYDDKGIKPSIFYNYEDKLYIGVGYEATKQRWRKAEFGSKHGIFARYSIFQKAMSFTYKGEVNSFSGKWNLGLGANYDLVRWTNFFGVGNETALDDDADNSFYRMRSREASAGFILHRNFGKLFRLGVGPYYQMVDIISDEERFVAKTYGAIKDIYEAKHFGGAALRIILDGVDNEVLPTRGIQFATGVAHTINLNDNNKSFQKYAGEFNFYIPLSKRFVLSGRSGAAAVKGNPEFYQLATIGGSETVRGYKRDRFYGTSGVYNANELQWLFNIRSKIFNGKGGLFGFYDQGRVWNNGETSNLWHQGYGGGIMLSPFNKITAALSYGISSENSLIHIRLNKKLR
jgi:hypothetical protein